MQTHLADAFKDTADGLEAQEILRRCVHCGFCLATCPTYQILGDERDSPRGRIYLIKQVLEGKPATVETQTHLDRCLTCRNCETTCPSGVEYGHLVDIGRRVVDAQVPRPPAQHLQREALGKGLNSPLFGVAMRAGQMLHPLLPKAVRAKVPKRRAAGHRPTTEHPRHVLILAGCTQPAMIPAIDASTIRLLDAVGISTQVARGSGCCGAVKFHLDDQVGGRAQMKANIDAWAPMIERGEVEAIVMNASGCGATVREYGHHLRADPVYAERARLVSEHVRDIAELLAPHAAELKARIGPLPADRVAFHPPCTLQHWQALRPVTEKLLRDLGFQLQPFTESHLCCGSAGTYSVLQPTLAKTLRDRKLGHIAQVRPEMILSSNIGCLAHLQGGTDIPVRHWVEALDGALAAA